MKRYISSVILISVLIFSCTPEPVQVDVDDRIGSLPKSILSPADNPSSIGKIALGKALFWDPILSGNKDVACVTCHHPSHGYAENLELSIGVGGEGISENRHGGTLVKRNSMSILNTAFNGINAQGEYLPENAPMFWDNRNHSLEEQAIQPILSAEEMRGTRIHEDDILDTILIRLQNIPEYIAMFQEVFGENSVTEKNIAKAMAAFQRTLITNNSRFDQYVDGDENALSSLEKRGMMNFIEVGCANCHNGPMFSDFELHVLTVPENDQLDFMDDGDGNFAFRTPSLRNLDITAPYMHNGIFETLEEVLDFYDNANGESQNPNIPSELRAPDLRTLNIPDDQVQSIIAFLESLTDHNFDQEIPNEVPSGLHPGGNIK